MGKFNWKGFDCLCEMYIIENKNGDLIIKKIQTLKGKKRCAVNTQKLTRKTGTDQADASVTDPKLN